MPQKLSRPFFTYAFSAGLLFASLFCAAEGARAQVSGSPDLVVSQIYTRGGEPGAVYLHDFIEIFNRGNQTVNLADYWLQVASAGKSVPAFWAARLSFDGNFIPLAPGEYFLFRFGGDGVAQNGSQFPVEPDANLLQVNLGNESGRVAIVKSNTIIVRFGCPTGVDASLVDLVGYGNTFCAEGAATLPAPTGDAFFRAADGCADTDANAADFSTAQPSPRNRASTPDPCGLPAPSNTFRFEAASLSVAEDAGGVEIFVTRAGDTSGAASVHYATVNRTASERQDFTTALGTLRFAAGETRKSFRLALTDDVLDEGEERLSLSLGQPSAGFALAAPHTLDVTIPANDAGSTAANPIDTSSFFVRQHYLDFLSREPDQAGLDFWTNRIESCGANASCRQVRRVDVSAAFFLSIEFQETGFLAYRAYKAAFPEAPLTRPFGFPVYREFWHDTQNLSRDLVVGVGDWTGRLEANKQLFAAEFVARPEFLIRYPSTLSPAEFVDALNQNAGGPLSTSERDALVACLEAGAPRANALRAVAEDNDFRIVQHNRAFVLMQFFGYLRRSPNDAPNNNFDGYGHWLKKLNDHNGDFRRAEMVRAFIESFEYRDRFGR